MFAPDQDFTVEQKHGIVRCIAKSPEVASAFKALQFVCSKLLEQLPNAPSSITLDGVIGPSTVLVVQLIAMRLSSGQHQGLAPLVAAQPEEAIPFVAQNAMEIAGYIDQVVAQDPTALVAPRAEVQPASDPVDMLKGAFTPSRIAAAGLGLLGLLGLAAVARMSDRRASGTIDRSNLLPDSDGSDEFDDGEDSEPEGQGEGEADYSEGPSSDQSAHAA